MTIRKQLFNLVVLLVLCLAPGVAFGVEVGAEAPGFTLKTLEGESVSLSDFKGRPVFVKLATTWCPTCNQLSGEIIKAGDELKARGVVVLEVFVQDSPAMVERFLKGKSFPMTFHALLDDGQAHKAYSVYLIPRLVLVGPDGLVAFDSVGQNVSAEDLKKLVKDYALVEAG